MEQVAHMIFHRGLCTFHILYFDCSQYIIRPFGDVALILNVTFEIRVEIGFHDGMNDIFIKWVLDM